MAKLGEYCEVNPSKVTLSDDKLISFVPMTAVSEEGAIDVSATKAYADVKTGFTCFQNGDVLFAKITPCMENGKGAIAENLHNGIGFGSTEFHVLRPDPTRLDSKYLYYCTVWPTFRKDCERNMTGSAGQKRVPKKYIETYDVSIPDLLTQRRIAATLDKVSEGIAVCRQMLADLDVMVKARFVEIMETANLGDETTIEAVSDRVKVGFVGTCEKYYTDNSGIPMLRTGNITEKGIDLRDLKYVTDEFNRANKKSQIHDGDLLIARHGSNGQANVYHGPEAQCLNAVIIVPDMSIARPIFLAGLINSPLVKKQIDSTLVGSTQHVINTKSIAALRVRIPGIDTQIQYEEFVAQADQSKSVVQQQLAELETLKKSLMQEYFG